MATTENKTVMHYITGSAEILAPSTDNRRWAVIIDKETKCEGVGCAYKQSCNRYITRNDGDHQFASFYAMADEDCQYHQPCLSEANNA